MSAPALVAGRTYSGIERAAVLMMLVGDAEAAAILEKLDPEEVRQLARRCSPSPTSARRRWRTSSTISPATPASAPTSASTRARGSRR